MSSAIQFCNLCGSKVGHRIPQGDTLPRYICDCCGHIHYQNPRLIVGCVAEWDGGILLCRRAIEPRLGLWTLPAGFMENGETTADAAQRETHEEAGAVVEIDAPFAMFSIPHINQVHLFYRGRMTNPTYFAGEESQEVALFHPDSIPWEEIAFRSVTLCLERYLADRSGNAFGFHEGSLSPA